MPHPPATLPTTPPTFCPKAGPHPAPPESKPAPHRRKDTTCSDPGHQVWPLKALSAAVCGQISGNGTGGANTAHHRAAAESTVPQWLSLLISKLGRTDRNGERTHFSAQAQVKPSPCHSFSRTHHHFSTLLEAEFSLAAQRPTPPIPTHPSCSDCATPSWSAKWADPALSLYWTPCSLSPQPFQNRMFSVKL